MGCRWRGEPTIASPKAAQSGYLGTRYSSGQVDDAPLCMESPARRPLSKQQWGTLRKDSLRPGEEESHLGVKMQKMGWLWKAVGRPPHRTWVRKWVYLLDDKLCWVAEEDVESMKVTRTTGALARACTMLSAIRYRTMLCAIRYHQRRPVGLPLPRCSSRRSCNVECVLHATAGGSNNM